MNQITETLPRQEKWNASGIAMKKNRENPKKSFEDILKRENETDVLTTLAGIGGEMVYSQVQPILFQTVPQELIGAQSRLEELSSASQIRGDAFTQQQLSDITETVGQSKEGKAVQSSAPENTVNTTGTFSNTASPIMQAVQENSIGTIQSPIVKNHTEGSLKSVSPGEATGKEKTAAIKDKKIDVPKDVGERPVSGEDGGHTVQAFQQMNGHTVYIRETAPGGKNAATLQENVQPDVQDLKYKIIDQITSGKKEFQVQLKPENLGMLLVKAAYDNGKAVISIVCMESKTMHVMMQNAEELGHLIQSRLGSPTEVVVETHHTDYLEQQNHQQDSGQQKSSYQQEQKEGAASEGPGDFLQQLRLGLT